jgi:hypothetical protein
MCGFCKVTSLVLLAGTIFQERGKIVTKKGTIQAFSA